MEENLHVGTFTGQELGTGKVLCSTTSKGTQGTYHMYGLQW